MTAWRTSALIATLFCFALSATAHARNGTSLSGLPAPLVEKVKEIQRTCGSKVISTHRPGARVRGSGRLSEHARGRAADIQGNPRCAYALLKGWRGGYSTDYGRVRHIHMSWGGREMGMRFAHYQGRKHRYVQVAKVESRSRD